MTLSYRNITKVDQNDIITTIANAGANQVVFSYSYMTLDGSASFDPKAAHLAFHGCKQVEIP